VIRSAALQYALAPACVALAALLHLTPAGPFLHPTGPFVIAVLAVAWFGGAGPGLLAAVLSTFALPQLVAPSYPLVGGFIDLPRFITFALIGLAVGLGATRSRRAEAALRRSEQDLEKKLIERTRAVQASEARFRSLNELSNDFFWETDAEHRYTALEPGRAYRGVRNDASKLGLASWEIPYASPDEAAWAAHRAAIAARERFIDFRFSRVENGEERFYELSGEPRYDAQGGFLGYCGVGRDITERKRAEEELRESEQRYALAMEASEEAHWDWIIPTDEYYAARSHFHLYGLPRDFEYSGRAQFLAAAPFHPEDRAKYREAVKALFAGRESRLTMDVRLITGGETRWVQIRGLCTRDASGVPVRYTGTVRDITDRKRLELALGESEKRYERVMQASEDGFWEWIVATDEFYASPRMLALYGLPPDTVFRGRADFLSRFPFHPEDLGLWRKAVAAHLAGQSPRIDLEVRAKLQGATRWIHLTGICLRDASGAQERWTGSVSDVTERRRAQEALRRSEERYALAVEAAGEGHSDWNLETGAFYISPRLLQICGYPPGTTFKDRADWVARFPFHPEDRPKWEKAVAAHMAGRAARFDMEARIVARGETRWVRFVFVCSRDPSGKPVRWTGSTTDVTDRKSAAEALRLSEDRYARAMEGSDAGHWDWNIVTDEMFVSRRAREMLELPADTDRLPRTRAEIMALVPMHPDDRSAMHEIVAASVASGRHEREYRVIARAGEVRWLRARGKIYRDPRGAAVRMTGSLTDITERKLAADELRESEARFRSLTELSSDWFWRQDENLRFTYMSDQAVALGGFSPEASIGKLRWELPGITPLSSSWAEHQAALAARQPFRDLELSRQMPDGSLTYYSISGAPIFDEQGRFKGYQGIGRSITERKRIEEELRARQEMLDLAQKSARATAFEWRLGDGGGGNRWSPDLEAMYGLVPGTYDGSFESWKKLVHREDWPAVKEAIQHAQRTGEVAAEYRVVHPDSSVHWLNARGRMFFDREGKPARMVGFMHDVTERRQAEEELKRLERQLRQAQRLEAMGTLAGGIAHDFNNILGAILGYGEMAQRDAAKGSRLARDLDSIIAAGERGRALVDRVLAFSRSGVGERVAVHFEKVVREALDLLAAKLPPNVTLHAKLHAGPAAMLGDATQVHQVLMNLATNAIQAMPSGGTLRVSLDAVRIDTARTPTIGTIAPAEYLALQVADTGTGIAPEIIERIFDPFFTTKEVGTGTGLGLSLVHGIVAELGGAIEVASTLGAGSTFTVYLPRSGDASEAFQEEEPELPRGDGQRVLIVDDEEPLVRLATRTLEELGYAPTGFTSSAAALAAFRADPQRFDALITDERMPGMSGSALIREVRGIRDGIPIVLMSGYVGGAVASNARDAGAEEVLKKPLSARDLAASLARVLHP